MFKKIIIIILVLIPSISYGAITITPDIYTSKPAEVSWTDSGLGSGAVLYSSEQSLPILCHESTAINTTGTINPTYFPNQNGCNPGYFTSSTNAEYKMVQASVVQCYNQSYDNCAASNPGMPGQYEADFTITDVTSTYATSSLELAEEQTLYLVKYLLDILIFSAVLVFTIWFFKR